MKYTTSASSAPGQVISSLPINYRGFEEVLAWHGQTGQPSQGGELADVGHGVADRTLEQECEAPLSRLVAELDVMVEMLQKPLEALLLPFLAKLGKRFQPLSFLNAEAVDSVVEHSTRGGGSPPESARHYRPRSRDSPLASR